MEEFKFGAKLKYTLFLDQLKSVIVCIHNCFFTGKNAGNNRNLERSIINIFFRMKKFCKWVYISYISTAVQKFRVETLHPLPSFYGIDGRTRTKAE